MARGVALAAAIAVSLLAVSGAGGAPTQQTPKRGGTVIAGLWREPPCVNAYLVRCGDSGDPANIMRLALRGAFEVGPELSWRPDLVSGARITTKPPYTITYRILPAARWSDGVPLTAKDFVFTHRTRGAVAAQLINLEKTHLSVIRSVTAVGTKTVKVVLNEKFAGWRRLFPHVLPQHALQGEDFSTVWLSRIHDPRTGRPIGSGPFLLESWGRERALTFVRNPRYWGSHTAHLRSIVIRFCRECADIGSEQIAQLRTGDLDLVTNTPLSGQEVQALRRLPGARVLLAPGPVWEHFEIRVGADGHPALKSKRVRQALAYGIDRVGIAQELYGAIDARYPPSDSAVFPIGSTWYLPNWSTYRYRPDEAHRLLERDGCRSGVDGIYACAGQRLSLRVVTTGDDQLRLRTLELLQGQLRRAGIEAKPVYAPRGTFFGQILPAALAGSGAFDVVLFAFNRGSPDAPSASHVSYGCDDIRNYSGYCQRLVTRDVDQARRILDEGHLARVLNRADLQLAKDVPVIPLLDRPLVTAFTKELRNVSLETRALEPFADVEDWWLDR